MYFLSWRSIKAAVSNQATQRYWLSLIESRKYLKNSTPWHLIIKHLIDFNSNFVIKIEKQLTPALKKMVGEIEKSHLRQIWSSKDEKQDSEI